MRPQERPAGPARRSPRRAAWLAAGGLAVAAAIGSLVYFSRPAGRPAPGDGAPADGAPPPDPILAGCDYVPPGTIEALREEEAGLVARLVQEFPASANAHYVLATVHESEGRHGEAEKIWKRCLEIDPRYVPACERRGAAALNAGDFEKAESLYRKVLELEPARPGASDGLASALLQQGKIPEAVAALEAEIRISPGSSQAYFHLGRARLLLRQYEKAKECYEKAVEIRPEYKFAYYGLVQACEKLGLADLAAGYRKKFESLEEDYREGERGMRRTHNDLVAMRRDVAVTYVNAGEVYRTEGNLEAAERHWKIAAVLDPRSVQPLVKLAALYERANRPALALAAHRRLSALEPQKAVHRFNAGNMEFLLRQYDAAEASYRRVVELAPQRADGYRALVQLYLATKGDPSRTIELARKAVEASPSGPNWFHLALACRMGGDRAGARAALERALSLDPGNPQYRQLYQTVSAEEAAR